MTEKEIILEQKGFMNLPYRLQYWCFDYFIKKNIKQAEYFIALINSYKEREKENEKNYYY